MPRTLCVTCLKKGREQEAHYQGANPKCQWCQTGAIHPDDKAKMRATRETAGSPVGETLPVAAGIAPVNTALHVAERKEPLEKHKCKLTGCENTIARRNTSGFCTRCQVSGWAGKFEDGRILRLEKERPIYADGRETKPRDKNTLIKSPPRQAKRMASSADGSERYPVILAMTNEEMDRMFQSLSPEKKSELLNRAGDIS